jgi:hypothetical protein
MMSAEVKSPSVPARNVSSPAVDVDAAVAEFGSKTSADEESAKVRPWTTTGVVVAVSVAVSVAVVVVVVLEPPQAASDSAIIEMPPAFAAFLAFFDSQAFTSLLVAFTILAKNKLMNPKENMLAVEGG